MQKSSMYHCSESFQIYDSASLFDQLWRVPAYNYREVLLLNFVFL